MIFLPYCPALLYIHTVHQVIYHTAPSESLFWGRNLKIYMEAKGDLLKTRMTSLLFQFDPRVAV